MKKQLLALAVAGAIAAPAMAQNVTISGTLDTGVLHKDAAGVKTTTTVGDDLLGSSVMSFKGSEDLGGGNKAFFELKTGLKMGTGATDNTTSTTKEHRLFDEASYVGLTMSGVSVAFGRIGTATDDIKSAGNMGANLFSDTDKVANETAGPVANTLRVDGKLAGVKYTLTNSRGGDVVEFANDVTSLGLGVNVAGIDFEFATAQATGDDKVKESVFNAKKTIGGVALVGSYLTNKRTGLGTIKVAKVGAKYSMGATDFIASYQNTSMPGDRDDQNAADQTGGEKALGAMLVQNLSKRTSVYVGYLNRGGDQDINYTTFGVQHKF